MRQSEIWCSGEGSFGLTSNLWLESRTDRDQRATFQPGTHRLLNASIVGGEPEELGFKTDRTHGRIIVRMKKKSERDFKIRFEAIDATFGKHLFEASFQIDTRHPNADRAYIHIRPIDDS